MTIINTSFRGRLATAEDLTRLLTVLLQERDALARLPHWRNAVRDVAEALHVEVMAAVRLVAAAPVRRPNPLPETLPVGTKMSGEDMEALTSPALKDADKYWAHWGTPGHEPEPLTETFVRADDIDWESVLELTVPAP